MSQLKRFQLGILLVLLVGLLASAPADADIYWCNSHAVGRATSMGTEAQPEFIRHPEYAGLGSLAVSSRYIFFGGDGFIGRADLNGSSTRPAFFRIPQPKDGLTASEASSLAVAGGRVYWTDNGTTIGRATERGTGIDPGFIKTEALSNSLRASDGHLYWVTKSAVGRASLDGRAIARDYIKVHELPVTATLAEEEKVARAGEIPHRGSSSISIAVASGYLFWIGRNGHSIGRVRLADRDVEPSFIESVDYVSTLVVGAGRLYWRSDVTPYSIDSTIESAAQSGGPAQPLIDVSNEITGSIAVGGA